MSPFGEYNAKHKIKEKEIRLGGRKVYVTMKTIKDGIVPYRETWKLLCNVVEQTGN